MSLKKMIFIVFSTVLPILFCLGCSENDDPVTDGDTESSVDGDMDSTEVEDTDMENTENESNTEEMEDGEMESETIKPACHTDIEVGEVKVFVSGLKGSEGIAFDGIDKMYVTSGTQFLAFDADGQQTLVAETPNSIGVAKDKDGNFILCGWGEESTDTRDGAIYKVTPDGQLTTLSDGVIANPNFITRTPWGTWLISDDMIPEIWEMTDSGETTLWCEDVPSPNGMVFSQDGSKLYVAGTFEDDGPLYEISITDDNKSGSVSKLFAFDEKTWNDGLAMDENGIIYLLANLAGEIHKVDADGKGELFVSQVNYAASAAFGQGEGFDPCSLYVTSLLGDTIWRIGTGVHGQPLYE